VHNHTPVSTLRRPAALIVGASTLLAIAALAHHPGGMVPPSTAHDGLVQIDAVAAPLQAMHGAMIALYVLLAGCHAVFAGMLGARRPPVLLAMAAYLAGCALICGAALLDGFVTPQLAHLYVLAPEPRALQVNVTLAAISVGIQVLTKAGLLAMSLALGAFGWALATGTPRRRGLAILAVAAGVLPAGFMLANAIRVGPSNLVLLFAPQAAWHAGMAWMLYEKKAARRLLQDHAMAP
jgi:hypothetical protein